MLASIRQVSIEDISDAAIATPAVDVVMEHQLQRSEQRRKVSELVVQLKDKLTEKQFRRLWMYCVDGKTEQQIAEIEGVDQQRSSKSILAAKKKIKKFFPES